MGRLRRWFTGGSSSAILSEARIDAPELSGYQVSVDPI
jgi:hypothetical protein